MNISIRKAGPATILDLEGALRLGHDKNLLELFHNKVQEIVESVVGLDTIFNIVEDEASALTLG